MSFNPVRDLQNLADTVIEQVIEPVIDVAQTNLSFVIQHPDLLLRTAFGDPVAGAELIGGIATANVQAGNFGSKFAEEHGDTIGELSSLAVTGITAYQEFSTLINDEAERRRIDATREFQRLRALGIAPKVAYDQAFSSLPPDSRPSLDVLLTLAPLPDPGSAPSGGGFEEPRPLEGGPPKPVGQAPGFIEQNAILLASAAALVLVLVLL